MSEQRKQKKDNYRAVIIGAGRIASGFDSLEKEEILTHAHAYLKNPKVELSGFFDIDNSAAEAAAKKWGCQAYEDLNSMMEELQPDIVSICTPDEAHYDNLIQVAEHNPRIIICEKPATKSIKETEKIIDLYKQKEIPVLINYSRRFDETVQKFRKDLVNGKYGRVIGASGIYTKGLLHNGSHMIDLCQYLFGEYKDGDISYEINDYDAKDRTAAGFCSFENCPQFHLVVGDERDYSIFELDILTEKARIRFLDSGMYISVQPVIDDPLFEGYKCLGDETKEKTKLPEAMSCLIKNAVDHLEKADELICSLEDALVTQKVCHHLLK